MTVQVVVPVFLKVNDTENLVQVPTDAGTNWEVKEELSAAAADPVASSEAAASAAATTMGRLIVRRIEKHSFIAIQVATQKGEGGEPSDGRSIRIRPILPITAILNSTME